MTTQPEQRDARDVDAVERVRAYVKSMGPGFVRKLVASDNRSSNHIFVSDLIATLAAYDKLAAQPPQRDGAEPVALGYVVMKGDKVDWSESCVCEDAEPLEDAIHEANGDSEDDGEGRPYRVVQFYTAPPPDERDAEIARLTAMVERQRQRLTELGDF